jgi:hypothetical protein
MLSASFQSHSSRSTHLLIFCRSELLQIIPSRLFMNHIEQRLCREPSCHRRPHSLIRKHSLLFPNLDCFTAPTRSRSVSQELRMTALFKTHKPEHRFFNGLTNSEETMVLQQRSFVRTEVLRDVSAFLFGENNAVEVRIQDVVLYLCLSFRVPRRQNPSLRCGTRMRPVLLYLVSCPMSRMIARRCCASVRQQSHLVWLGEWQHVSYRLRHSTTCIRRRQ